VIFTSYIGWLFSNHYRDADRGARRVNTAALPPRSRAISAMLERLLQLSRQGNSALLQSVAYHVNLLPAINPRRNRAPEP
jgi:hypothetical protein